MEDLTWKICVQVFYSIVCILTYYLFGALVAILGPSVPELAPKLGRPATLLTQWTSPTLRASLLLWSGPSTPAQMNETLLAKHL